MTSQPATGQLAPIVARLVFASKLARSIYKAEINILWLKRHPEEVTDFLDFNIIQQKELFDTMDEEQQQAVSVEQRERLQADFTQALQRFGVGKGKTRPRNEWCSTSFYDRAKAAEEGWREEMEAEGREVEPVSLYKAFYRPASSMHHGDIGGLIAQVDSDMNVDLAPSGNWLKEALINGISRNAGRRFGKEGVATAPRVMQQLFARNSGGSPLLSEGLVPPRGTARAGDQARLAEEIYCSAVTHSFPCEGILFFNAP